MVEYRICKKCVMDTSDHYISFDKDGVCNHCHAYLVKEKDMVVKGKKGREKWESLVAEMKKYGHKRKYDCLLGVSGGTDSSFMAYLVWKAGLRPLIVHFDNGWDTELAINNIEMIIKKTGFDLFTIVVDFEEFKDIHFSYMKASVVDWEVVTDHAIGATIYKVAKEKGIKYILAGANVATEAIMGKKWSYRKNDLSNLMSIHKKFGTKKLKTFPCLGVRRKIIADKVGRKQTVYPLNLVDYNPFEARKILEKEFGWRNYGGKHYESLFTKYYQAYVLPTKFDIDKRRGHFSTLINSGQMSREKALAELTEPLYCQPDLESDTEYFLKKMDITPDEFDKLMLKPRIEHERYGTDFKWLLFYTVLFSPVRVLRKLWRKIF